MSPSEFLAAYGPPSDARQVTEAQALQGQSRVPESLVEFWRDYGVGSYADGNYWLCTPDLFDATLDRMLANVPHLRGRLTAFGYSSTGQVDLWEIDGRLWSLLLPFSYLDDASSRRETEPVPHDLAEIYDMAGIQMPPNAVEEFLAARSIPEDIWSILFGRASRESQEFQLGDDDASVVLSLRRYHGALSPGEIYRRRPDVVEELASSFDLVTLQEVFAELPATVTVTRSIEVDGQQELISDVYPIENAR